MCVGYKMEMFSFCVIFGVCVRVCVYYGGPAASNTVLLVQCVQKRQRFLSSLLVMRVRVQAKASERILDIC